MRLYQIGYHPVFVRANSFNEAAKLAEKEQHDVDWIKALDEIEPEIGKA